MDANNSNERKAEHARRPYSLATPLRWYERGFIAWVNQHVRPYVEETTRQAEQAARYLGVLSVVVFTLLATTVHAQECPGRKLEEILVVTTTVTDFAMTEYFLATNPALAEGNPLGQSTAARVGIKTGATVGILLLARHFDAKGAHGTAKILRWTSITAWGGATGWNIHIGMTVGY